MVQKQQITLFSRPTKTINYMQGVFTGAPLPFSIHEVADRKESDKVLLCTPDYFDIIDEKNVHMQGNIGTTDKQKVKDQWQALKAIYNRLHARGILKEVSLLPGAEGCEDMVFCANQTFPWQRADGSRIVVMSRMRHASREREVVHFERFFSEKGFIPLHFRSGVTFEGMGDVIPHPHKRLVYGGYGHRTSLSAYEDLSAMLDTPVIALELVNPGFYHLDTCFVPLSADSVMLCEEAFTAAGLGLIGSLFARVHVIPAAEAVQYFSLNAHVMDIDGHKTAILHPGSSETRNVLLQEGYEVHETDTSEFMKSGGSVFCMKMMYP